jgi:hypothetical protein
MVPPTSLMALKTILPLSTIWCVLSFEVIIIALFLNSYK